jgi:hypothetical protein
MLKLIGLLVVIGVAGYFTRPDEATLRAAANTKLEQVTSAATNNVDLGGALSGIAAQASGGVYENFYVASRYSAPDVNQPLVQCWGVFTQAICNKVGSPE